jgi:hypothetical protein
LRATKVLEVPPAAPTSTLIADTDIAPDDGVGILYN